MVERGEASHAELAAHGQTDGVELREDAITAAVLAVALPRDDEVTGDVAGDRRIALAARGVAVDPELAAVRVAGAEIVLREDADGCVVRPVALPHHHEVPAGVDGHGGE